MKLAQRAAGLVVGVVALPLSMALAIASGVRPENGLYTAIVAGFVIALLGGSSRFAIQAAAELYAAILDDIEAHDYDVFSRRARTNDSRKP